MKRIKDNNYYQVSGWMINRLGLSGRELHAYAIIYGFTQDGETEFNGSLTYIMEWLGTSSYHTALRAINKLIDMGLITKRQVTKKGVTTNFYKAVLPYPTATAETAVVVLPKQQRGTAETAGGDTAETAGGATAETADNNNSYKDINNNRDNLLAEEAQNDHVPYAKIKELYNKTCIDFSRVITISPNRKKAIAARWKEYGGNIETFEKLFRMTEESNFLKGQNERHWTANFDWLMKSANMTKVLEGNYRNKNASPSQGLKVESKTKVMTTAELEEKLRQEGSFKGYPDFDAMFGGKKNGTNG